MVFDHKNVDLIFSPKKMKVYCFVKGDYSDHVYAIQNRFFEFLVKKGIVAPDSVKGSNVFGGLEGVLFNSDQNLDIVQIVLLNIGKWLEEERPQLEFDEKYNEEWEKSLLEPSEEESTELGEIPQKAEKRNYG